MTNTHQNLQAAFAGESQAHVKYRYFAKICKEHGFDDLAEHFWQTADQELLHAWAHLELLHKNITPRECLELAILGETYEYTTMYPEFKKQAEAERDYMQAQEMMLQTTESQEHANKFLELLNKATKRFSALVNVERKHAEQYKKFGE